MDMKSLKNISPLLPISTESTLYPILKRLRQIKKFRFIEKNIMASLERYGLITAHGQ